MGPIWRSMLILVAAGAALVGCGSAPADSPVPSPTPAFAPTAAAGDPPLVILAPPTWQIACQGMPEQLCREMAGDAEWARRPGDPPLHTILVRCVAAPCTEQHSEGETVVFFADGSSRTVGTWGYGSATPAGTPPPPRSRPGGDWQLECQRVDQVTCEQQAIDSYEAIEMVGLDLARLVVRCTSATCDSNAGQGETVATFVDGSSRTVSSWDYATQVAPPPAP